jgi:hypothetical protein
VRYRTAVIVSGVLIALTCGMFGVEAALRTVLLPPSELGFPVSGFDRALFGVDFFCERWKWFLALLTLPVVVVLFTIAVFTSDSRADEMASLMVPPTGRPPALWNPKAAALWSLIFTQAFGAFLHARNADAMGRVDEAKANRTWFYISMAYFGLTFVATAIPAIPRGLFRLIPIGLLFGWYLNVGKKQVIYVSQTCRDVYVRKSLKEPLLIAFCCLICTFIAIKVAEKLVFGLQ